MVVAIVVDPCIKQRDWSALLVVGGAEVPLICAVAGQSSDRVMLLGTTESIAAKPRNVNFF